MKTLIIQENGRHEENRGFRECFSLKRGFKKLGHTADVWGLGHENYATIPDYESYDLIINLENYQHTAGNWVPDLSGVNTIKFLWAIDAHCVGIATFENEYIRGKYNLILHSTRDFVNKDYHAWLPNSFDDDLIKPLNLKKKYDFGFCGNYVNRKYLLDDLKERHNLHLDIFVIGNSMVRAINEYKCHFNYNMEWGKSSGINYRNFETIGCGTLLLTNYSDEYEDLGFRDGVNCFIWNSGEELEQRINYIKNNQIDHIAATGYELSKKHTYTKRVEKLIETHKGLIQLKL